MNFYYPCIYYILTKLQELTSVASITSDNNFCLVEPSSSLDFVSSSTEISCNVVFSSAKADSFRKYPYPYVICMLKRTPPWQG